MEEILNRIETAINFLKDGLPFKIGELYCGIDENNFLNITGSSQSVSLKSITKQSAQNELYEIKNMFLKLVSVSVKLRDYVKNKKVKFNLDFDYGMGDIRICSERDGVIEWLYPI
jgi:hypothetical protein